MSPDQDRVADSAIEAQTVCEAFQATVRDHADRVALRTKGDGVVLTWADYGERARAVAAGLAAQGVSPGDCVATQLVNRPEFHYVDMGAAHLGATPFGVYNTSSPSQIVERLDNADATIIFTEEQFLPAVREAAKLYGELEQIVMVDGPAEGTMTLEDLIAAGDPDFDFEAAWRSVGPDDILTMIYTSGTTGPPKGAQWTHGAVTRFLRAWGQALPFPTNEVSYLPLAHAGERMLTHYMPLAAGATVTTCPNVREVFAHFTDAHPDFFVTVPRTWSKLKSSIVTRIEALEPEQQTAVKEALEVGLERVKLDWDKQPVPEDLARRHEEGKQLIRSLLLEEFGLDKLKLGFIGSAPPPPEDVRFFHAIGILLLEGYGLTEATAFASVWPRVDDFKYGRVGKPLPGVELKMAEDNEILLRSDMNMAGYRKEPEATAEALDSDGWLHTGDIGDLDDEGYLAIVDRKKALIINSNGKNMSPANIETAIKRESELIGQIVAIGDDRDYNVALMTLEPEAATIFARDNGLDASGTEMADDPAVIGEIQQAVDRANEHLSPVEHVKRFKLLPDDWEPDSDELTPTMKVKRKPVAEKYSDEIEALYDVT
jgi:long-chain acyl-CoA synthetase